MRRLLMVTGVLMSSLGCRPSETSEAKYGTWSTGRNRLNNFSILRQIYNNQGSISIGLSYSGVIPTYDQDQAMRKNIDKAIREWIYQLDPNAYPYRVPNIFIGDSGSHRIIVDANVIRSYTVPDSKLMVLSGQYINQYDANSYRVILHEMGHFIGLADTYTEPGYQQPINQPRSIMNYTYSFDGLQSDDIAGVKAIWSYMQGTGMFCGSPYTIGGAYENKYQIAFCVPEGQ